MYGIGRNETPKFLKKKIEGKTRKYIVKNSTIRERLKIDFVVEELKKYIKNGTVT